jgi:hypothetical protein
MKLVVSKNYAAPSGSETNPGPLMVAAVVVTIMSTAFFEN